MTDEENRDSQAKEIRARVRVKEEEIRQMEADMEDRKASLKAKKRVVAKLRKAIDDILDGKPVNLEFDFAENPEILIDSTLNAALAATLERNGIRTLGELRERMRMMKNDWWVDLEAIGQIKADEIQEWEREQPWPENQT